MSVNSKEARHDVLNQGEQASHNAIERSLRVVIPAEFFAQAAFIVEDHRAAYPGDLYMMWGRRLSVEERSEAARRYRENKFETTDSLGERFDYSGETMRHVLMEEGEPLKETGPQVGYEIKKLPTQKIINRYKQNGSTTLAPEFGVAHTTILDRVKNAGEVVRPRGGVPLPLPMDEIAAEYMNDKATLEELAKKHHVSSMTMHNRLKERPDVQLRPPGTKPKAASKSK